MASRRTGGQILLTMLVFAAPSSVQANPCVLDFVGGRNMFAASPQPDIFIAREQIRFALQAKAAWVKHPTGPRRDSIIEGEVSISYELDNRGAAREMVVGFPIGQCNDDDCPAKNIISAFRAQGAGAGRLLRSADGNGLNLGEAAINRCEMERADGSFDPNQESVLNLPVTWYVWPQSFKPGLNKLDVRYHLKVIASEDGEDATLIVSYILKTTAGWGDGRIGQLDIDFTMRGRGSWQSFGRWEEPTATHGQGKLHWRLHDFAPKDDFGLAYEPPRNGRTE
jgi:hypothetical protein